MNKPQTASRKSTARRWPGPALKPHWLRDFVTENSGLKLLSLLLALILFAISRQPFSEVTLVGVPLEFRGLRAGLEINGDVPQTVSVRLRGPQNLIRTTTTNQIGVVADLGSKEVGERVVQLKPADVSRPDNVEVLRIEPSNIRLQIEPTLHKQIPIQPQFLGEVAAGFERRSFTVQPSLIEISGAQSHLTGLTSALTESIQLDGRTESFKITVDVDLQDRFIRVNTPGSVTVTVEIAAKK